MEKLNELKYNTIGQLEQIGAPDELIRAVADAGSEAEVQNIIAQWQRSDDYANNVQSYVDADASNVSAVVPRGFTNVDPSSKLRQDFSGMPRSSLRPALALYNNANGTNYTEPQVDSILSTPQDMTRKQVDDFVAQYKQERRVQDSIQDVLNYQNSWIGKSIKPLAQTIDGVSGFVPGLAGNATAAIGPIMRAYDRYRRGEKPDYYNLATDIGFNEMGQSLGGKVLKYGANLAQRMPYINRFAPTMIRASQAKRMDNASFANPIIALKRKLEQLASMKAGKSPREQMLINQEIVKIAEEARKLGLRKTEPIYRSAIEEAKVFSNGNTESFVRPFTTGEKVLATVDDGLTKYGFKQIPHAVNGLLSDENDGTPIEKAKESTRKASIPLLKYLIKLDSLNSLGYDKASEEYNYVSRLLGVDSLPPEERVRVAREAIAQDTLAGDWRNEYR